MKFLIEVSQRTAVMGAVQQVGQATGGYSFGLFALLAFTIACVYIEMLRSSAMAELE